jgi:hypothetical protein
MSNSRAFRRHLTNALGALDGARLPGGCEECNAYQTVRPVEAGIWSITVHHDEDRRILAVACGEDR